MWHRGVLRVLILQCQDSLHKTMYLYATAHCRRPLPTRIRCRDDRDRCERLGIRIYVAGHCSREGEGGCGARNRSVDSISNVCDGTVAFGQSMCDSEQTRASGGAHAIIGFPRRSSILVEHPVFGVFHIEGRMLRTMKDMEGYTVS